MNGIVVDVLEGQGKVRKNGKGGAFRLRSTTDEACSRCAEGQGALAQCSTIAVGFSQRGKGFKITIKHRNCQNTM
jgi:hypothetical protein